MTKKQEIDKLIANLSFAVKLFKNIFPRFIRLVYLLQSRTAEIIGNVYKNHSKTQNLCLGDNFVISMFSLHWGLFLNVCSFHQNHITINNTKF